MPTGGKSTSNSISRPAIPLGRVLSTEYSRVGIWEDEGESNMEEEW